MSEHLPLVAYREGDVDTGIGVFRELLADPNGDVYRRVDVDALLDDVRAVLADVPGEFDMIEHNPDEGMCAFCCGGDVHRKYAGGGGWTYHVGHASDCWYVRLVQLRDDLADNPEE